MKKPSKLKVALGLVTYLSTVGLNYEVHFFNSIRDAKEAGPLPFFSERAEQLMAHQEKCMDEIVSPWLLVPGSFLWRQPERPDAQPEKTYENQNPREYLIRQV